MIYHIICQEESSFLMVEKVQRTFAYLSIGTNSYTDVKYKNLCNDFRIKFSCRYNTSRTKDKIKISSKYHKRNLHSHFI
jgi:hypothetical protein